MIISHENRYLFIEIPLTASWAIRHELCEYYGGEPILHKHASYPEFARIASREEKAYFTFATVRNPLDVMVSNYFKLRTNHKGVFTDPLALQDGKVEKIDLEKFRFIHETDADFESYFRRYHNRPYSNEIDLSAQNLDFVLRFDYLQEDFSEVLLRLQLRQVGLIPVMNKTEGREPDWQSYYGPASIEQAIRKFGPFMRRWGIGFPQDWGSEKSTVWDEFYYRSLAQIRKLYVSRIRYSSGIIGRVTRAARAVLIK